MHFNRSDEYSCGWRGTQLYRQAAPGQPQLGGSNIARPLGMAALPPAAPWAGMAPTPPRAALLCPSTDGAGGCLGTL